MKDDRLTDCPLETCDGQVKRLLGTGAGIIFKGSGFYQTDYRSESYKKSAKADSSSGDSSSSGGSSSSDSKSAASSSESKPASTPAKSDS